MTKGEQVAKGRALEVQGEAEAASSDEEQPVLLSPASRVAANRSHLIHNNGEGRTEDVNKEERLSLSWDE